MLEQKTHYIYNGTTYKSLTVTLGFLCAKLCAKHSIQINKLSQNTKAGIIIISHFLEMRKLRC